MSIKNGLVGSAIGFSLSAGICNAFLHFTNKDVLNVEENDEGEVKTLSRFQNLPFKRIADCIVLLSGAYGFYCGYNKRTLLLKNM